MDLSGPAARREALRSVDVQQPDQHLDLLRAVFDAERDRREHPNGSEVGDEFEHVHLAAFLLFLAGDPADSLRVFGAKFRTRDFDLATGLDAHAAFGAGRQETLRWLTDGGHRIERDELAAWLTTSEDPTIEEWAASRRGYFYAPGGVLLLDPL